jgi:hypothetical protein
MPWAFLDDARTRNGSSRGAIVVTGDAEDPVFACVASLPAKTSGVKVQLEILPGDPFEYVEVMRRSHLLIA